MKEEIIKHIEDILKEEGVENPKVNLSPSVYLDKGDYSTNVAMVYAKAIDNTPMYLAERIKSHLESRNIFGVTVANPGFINFFFDKKYFEENVKKIIEQHVLDKMRDAGNFMIFVT
jgi:arginyl-tRNA synthetase